MLIMEKKRYLTPQVRQITSFDEEFQIICTSIDQKNIVLVDPLDEKYYDGTDGTSDYLIKF